MKKIVIFLLAACITTACREVSSQRTEMDGFLDSLMGRMTLEEKIGQLNLLTMGFDVTGPRISKGVEQKIRDGHVGGVFNLWTPNAVRKLQDTVLTQTRLKIPLLIGYDVIHGHRTIFPIPLAQAATWDIGLIERIATVVADEASADGLHWTFSPMVDLVRDPRWGRVSDTAGEDSFLGSEIAKAMVRGYEQGDLSNESTIMSCVKHFALYGAAEGGRDYNTVDMSRLRMYNDYLPPYKAAIEAGASSIMTSFNEVDGIPATGNRWLLTDLLREQWKFEGFVVADYTSVSEMENHGMGDKAAVTERAINAGLDMDMVSEYFTDELPALVKSGKVKEETVNAACRRILEAKYKLGLFDNPYRGITGGAGTRVSSAEKFELNREAALKSIVLLKNDGRTLPLDDSKRIAFVGPLVKNRRTLLGSSAAAADWRETETLWEALCSRRSGGRFTYAQGCHLVEDSLIRRMTDQQNGNVLDDRCGATLIREAVEVAERSDVVVAVLGEAYDMSGEAAGRSDIGLLSNQKALLRALEATGKPIVLVLMNGRPLTLQWEDDHIEAIVETWLPGACGGSAIVDILFGEVNPSGKITMTFPRNVGQIPIYYNYKNTGRPYSDNSKFTVKHIDVENSPLYPFGHGLSYTQFAYSPVRLSDTVMTVDRPVEATVTVSNVGLRSGEETVQFYIRDLVGSVTRPVKELKGFRRIKLEAGESEDVTFTVTPDMLKFYNSDLEWVFERGDFLLFAGGSSATDNVARFTLE